VPTSARAHRSGEEFLITDGAAPTWQDPDNVPTLAVEPGMINTDA
jgi:hypothetical protein